MLWYFSFHLNYKAPSHPGGNLLVTKHFIFFNVFVKIILSSISNFEYKILLSIVMQ